MELDGGVSRVAGLLDTLAAADRMQAAAARARADAMLSNGAAGAASCPSLVVCPASDFGNYCTCLVESYRSPDRVLPRCVFCFQVRERSYLRLWMVTAR